MNRICKDLFTIDMWIFSLIGLILYWGIFLMFAGYAIHSYNIGDTEGATGLLMTSIFWIFGCYCCSLMMLSPPHDCIVEIFLNIVAIAYYLYLKLTGKPVHVHDYRDVMYRGDADYQKCETCGLNVNYSYQTL